MRDFINVFLTEGASTQHIGYLEEYFEVRPLELSDWNELPDLWLFFVHQYLNEDNLNRLAAHLGKAPDEIDEEDFSKLPQKAHDFFIDWLDERGYLREWQFSNPASCPTWVLLEPIAVIPEHTWLIHFTDHASSIVLAGFTRGTEDIDRLALTRPAGADSNSQGPGYNFAFACDGTLDIEGRALQSSNGDYYGNQAVLFHAPGLRVHHLGDREQQVIFWGPEAKNMHKIERIEHRWLLDGHSEHPTIQSAINALG